MRPRDRSPTFSGGWGSPRLNEFSLRSSKQAVDASGHRCTGDQERWQYPPSDVVSRIRVICGRPNIPTCAIFGAFAGVGVRSALGKADVQSLP